MQGDGTNAADREGDGKTDMGSSGLVPEAGQVSLVAQPGVLPERTPDDTSVDPGGRKYTICSDIYHVDTY